MDKLPERSAKYLGGDFANEYRRYIDAIVAPNKQAQISNNTQVMGAAIESLTGDEASAIVYTNSVATTPADEGRSVAALHLLSAGDEAPGRRLAHHQDVAPHVVGRHPEDLAKGPACQPFSSPVPHGVSGGRSPRHLADRGWDVVAGVRTEQDADDVVAVNPERISSVILDVTDDAQIADLAESLGPTPRRRREQRGHRRRRTDGDGQLRGMAKAVGGQRDRPAGRHAGGAAQAAEVARTDRVHLECQRSAGHADAGRLLRVEVRARGGGPRDADGTAPVAHPAS